MSKKREASESGFYHVCVRGAGQQIIFEDDDDRRRFLYYVARFLKELPVMLFAWAIMDNHVHLVLHARELDALSEYMRRLEISYAGYFNRAYERMGPVFQGRFESQPISSDEQLLAVVRYVHLNPEKAGLGEMGEYLWSSYREYEGDRSRAFSCTNVDMVLSMIGGVDQLGEFHRRPAAETFIDVRETPDRKGLISDARALRISERILGVGWRHRIWKMSRELRDEAIRTLYRIGLSMRQISRMASIGRALVRRLCQGLSRYPVNALNSPGSY